LLWKIDEITDTYNQNGIKKKISELNHIFSDVANVNQRTMPRYLEINTKISKFMKMDSE